MKYYKSKQTLPGHTTDDILVEVNDYYMWQTEPYYTFPKEIVENTPSFFYEVNVDINEGEHIWYISMNGIVVADTYAAQRHSSLKQFGNIFMSEQAAVEMNTKIKQVLQAGNH